MVLNLNRERSVQFATALPISWGNLIERTDDIGRVSRLKCVDVWALMHYHGVAVRQCKCQDCPKITLGNISSRLVVVLIHVVDVPGERGELKNPWTGWGSCESKSQWMGSIRIHDLRRHLCDRNPDDEHKDGDSVGGNRWAGKEDPNHGQGTGRGDDDRDDSRRMEGRLNFYFEHEFHAQML
jgi:hypothetical protein